MYYGIVVGNGDDTVGRNEEKWLSWKYNFDFPQYERYM